MSVSGRVSGRMSGNCSGRNSGRAKFTIPAKRKQESSEWDADFLAFWARTTGTPDAWKLAYNNFIVGLKQLGYWQKADAIHCFAAHNESDARLNLKSDSFNCTAHNSPLFTTKSGFSSGTYGYLNTQFRAMRDGVKYTRDNAAVMVILETPMTTTSLRNCFGSIIGAQIDNFIQIGYGNLYYGINGAYSLFANTADISGAAAVSRPNSTTIETVINGTLHSALDPSDYSSQSTDIYYLCLNGSGTAERFSDGRQGFGFIGAYLSEADISAINNLYLEFKSEIASL